MTARLFDLVILAGLLVLALRVFEWKSLYYPVKDVPTTPGDLGLAFEDVYFMTEDGKQLHGWWMPHPEARGTVLYLHGNAGNITDRIYACQELQRQRVQVFIFDYRGYGRSRGWPTEQGTYRDARAAYEVVRARYDDAERPPVVLYGSSLGGAIAIHLATEKPVRGVMVEGTFTSVADVGERLYPWLPVRWINRYRYDARSRVARVAAPLLVVHSRQDQLIPFELGEQLFRAASEPKQFVAIGGEHSEASWSEFPEYQRALESFLHRTLSTAE